MSAFTPITLGGFDWNESDRDWFHSEFRFQQSPTAKDEYRQKLTVVFSDPEFCEYVAALAAQSAEEEDL